MVLRCVFDGNSTNTTVTHASFKNVNTVQVNKQHVLDSRGVEGQCSFGLKSLLVFCAVTVLFFFFFFLHCYRMQALFSLSVSCGLLSCIIRFLTAVSVTGII